MSEADKIRNFMKLVEGELIPHRENTIKLSLSDYDTVRMLIHLPDDYEPNKRYKWDQYSRIMTFWDSVSFLKIKERLDKLGINYEDVLAGMTNFRDTELEKETEHVMSPYPSNQHIQVHNQFSEQTENKPKRRKKIKISKK